MKHQTEELSSQEAKETTGGTSVRNHAAQSPYGDMSLAGMDDGLTQPAEMPVKPDTYGSDRDNAFQPTA